MAALRIGSLQLISAEPKIRTLHLTWLAFFVSFIVWFNHAPLMAAIQETFKLSKQEVAALLILNVALTIPARIIVGMLVDKLGPRLMYSALLAISGMLCLAFAFAESFTTLAITRFLLGFVGAGFVVGIRMIGEWFPAKETGLAQGIYAGFGNFGSAAAGVTLPTLALYFGGTEGWRYSIAITGVIAFVYGLIYYMSVEDTPKGSTYFKPKKIGAMEVTSRGDFVVYCIMQAPLVLALAVLAWKLGPSNLNMLSATATWAAYFALAAYYLQQVYDTWRINKPIFSALVPEIHRYKFQQVAVLDIAYLITFGSELAVVSLLPLFFKDTFGLTLTTAGLLGASFGATTFFARPAGGWLSDKFGRRNVLLVCLAGTAAGYLAMSQMKPELGIAFARCSHLRLLVVRQRGQWCCVRHAANDQAATDGADRGNGRRIWKRWGRAVLDSLFVRLSRDLLPGGRHVLNIRACTRIPFLEEPKGQIAEYMPDGTVTMIEVA